MLVWFKDLRQLIREWRGIEVARESFVLDKAELIVGETRAEMSANLKLALENAQVRNDKREIKRLEQCLKELEGLA
jgi:hypothetical protein